MDIYKPNSAGQAEARGEKSGPSIPCSILVGNSYASHLFSLFRSKLVLTCIFKTSFCPQLSLLGLLTTYFLISFLHICTAQAQPICDFPPEMQVATHRSITQKYNDLH